MKKIFILFGFLVSVVSLQAQIVGGAGIVKTASNPNTITSLRQIDQRYTASLAYDTTAQSLYKYDVTAPIGARWVVQSTENISVVGSGYIVVTKTGNVYTVSNTAPNTPTPNYTVADNPAHAATLNVAVGQTFLASNGNTMGVPAGTYVQRMF